MRSLPRGPVLVTGATGLIGHHITRLLVESGVEVRALVRQPSAAQRFLPGVQLIRGDLTEAATVRRSIAGVRTVFHAAGLPEQWLRDPARFDQVNVFGTRAVVRSALFEGVETLVYTSTVDVFEHTPLSPFDEARPRRGPLNTPYQRSKQAADDLVARAIGESGLPARIVHPAAVFGPTRSHTPGLNQLIINLACGRQPILPPGGTPLVYAPDAAAGHLLAAQAPVGSRFILSDRYLTLRELAGQIRELVPHGNRPRVLPVRAAGLLAAAGERAARVTRRPPMLPAGQLAFLLSGTVPDATAAQAELGWTTTPLRAALAHTISSLLNPHSSAHR